jgi:hypothetical protein
MINESLGISQIEKTNEKTLDYCTLQYLLPRRAVEEEEVT